MTQKCGSCSQSLNTVNDELNGDDVSVTLLSDQCSEAVSVNHGIYYASLNEGQIASLWRI